MSDESSAAVEGRYANYFKVGYNAFEFLLDFGQSYQDAEKLQAHIRVAHGNETVAETTGGGGFQAMSDAFGRWVEKAAAAKA